MIPGQYAVSFLSHASSASPTPLRSRTTDPHLHSVSRMQVSPDPSGLTHGSRSQRDGALAD